MEFRRLNTSCDGFYPAADLSSSGWIRFSADSILRLTRVSAAEYELQLILSYGWLVFRWLDTRCGWFCTTTDSSSGGWIRVAADSTLRLTRVPAARYKLRLIPSHGWLEFRRLDRSCGWFHHTADSSSRSWIRVAADSILRLFRVPAAGYELWLTLSCGWLQFRRLDTSYSWFHPAAGYGLRLFYLAADSRSAGWFD